MSEHDIIHLKAPRGWINDPNGFIYYRGMYHLFYQHFPYAPIWGRMHWGHAVSKDLAHWEHKGIALYPSKYDDRSGCFSGSAVEHDGKMHLFYTGVNYTHEDPENINCCINGAFISAQLSISSEDGMTFDNICGKTTVIPPITDSNIGSEIHTRDPKVWRGENAWYMVLGSTVDQKGRLLFYRSDDLQNWTYVNHAELDDLGWMWECPDYFETESGNVLIFSPMGLLKDGKKYEDVSICTLARFNEDTCTMQIADGYQFLDYGLDLYAPQSTIDEYGNRVVAAWVRMPEAVNGEWSGMFCIPRVVEVKNNHIYFRPHPNAEKLFTKKIDSPVDASAAGYKLSMDIHNGENINIGGYVITCGNNKIYTDRFAVFAGHDEVRCQFETPEIYEPIHLDIYADKNLIEIYINNGEYVLSNAVYGLSDEIIGDNYELFTIADEVLK